MKKLSLKIINQIIKDRKSGLLIGMISWKYKISLSRLVFLFEKQLKSKKWK
jgi:hypothetical protein